MFGPLMLYTALVDTLQSYERQFGTATYSVQGQLRVKNHEPIGFDNMFAGENAASAAAAVAGTLTNTVGVLSLMVAYGFIPAGAAFVIGATHGLPEVLLAVIVTVPVVRAVTVPERMRSLGRRRVSMAAVVTRILGASGSLAGSGLWPQAEIKSRAGRILA